MSQVIAKKSRISYIRIAMKNDAMTFRPIGYLESCYKDKFGTPRQPGLSPHSKSSLRIRGDLQPEASLQGIEGFSHVWLIFLFHENQSSRFHAKVHPPRLEGRAMGLFATRTPHRPNPIGLSLVKLDKVVNGVLYFSGADLIEGTPILDIKPYIPSVEAIPSAKVGWVSDVDAKNIQVEFSIEAQQVLNSWQSEIKEEHLEQLIIDTICLDPRPTVYKGFEGQESPYRQTHVFRLFDKDIHFTFIDQQKAVVTMIQNYISEKL